MRPLIGIGTALAVGLHWILLQCIAWLGMAVVYSDQEGSIVEGLSKTFDGQHPCPMCLAIKDAKSGGAGEDPQVPGRPEVKVESKLVPCLGEADDWKLAQFPPSNFGRGPARMGSATDRASEPPLEPPRAAWA